MTTSTGMRDLRRFIHRELVIQADRIIAALQPQPATGFRLQIGVPQMATFTFTVDENEVVSVEWLDDKGDVTTAPDGASVSMVSGDATVVENPVVGQTLVVHKAGEVDVTATAVGADDAPLANFATETVHLSITPGAAASFDVSVAGTPPVPVSKS